MALVLVRPEFDRLAPGEHTGTFRGNVPAFVTATEALRFWRDDTLERQIARKAGILRAGLQRIAEAHPEIIKLPVRGRGMIQGLETCSGETARQISAAAFSRGLMIETAGPQHQVLKALCPLTIPDEDLTAGLILLEAAVGDVG